MSAAVLPSSHHQKCGRAQLWTYTLLGFVYRRLPVVTNHVELGIAFGGLIWLVSYVGWVPTLGMMPPIHRDRPDHHPAIMALAH